MGRAKQRDRQNKWMIPQSHTCYPHDLKGLFKASFCMNIFFEAIKMCEARTSSYVFWF